MTEPDLNAIRQDLIRRSAIRSVPQTPLYQAAGLGGTVEKSQTTFGSYYMTYDVLRFLREKIAAFSIVHTPRHVQIARMAQKWSGKPIDVGWEFVHKEHNQRDKKPPRGFEVYIDLASSYLLEPDPGGDARTTASLLVALWEDFATINHPAAQFLTSSRGEVVGIRAVDGGIIWPMLEWMRWYERENPNFIPQNATHQQRLDLMSERLAHDLTAARWCLVRDGIPQRYYRDEELIVAPFVNRTDVRWLGYYPGKVEASLEMALHFFNAMESNGGWFTKGAWVETLLALYGNVTDEDLKRIREDYRQATQGVDKNQQLPLVRLGDTVGDVDMKPIQVKKNPQDMGFQSWTSFLLSFISAIYRMDPSTFNMKSWDGGTNPSLNAPNREKEIGLAKEEGLQSDLSHLKAAFLDPFAIRIHPDLRLVWHYGDFDQEKENRINEIRIRVDTTINEVRLEQGRRPLGYFLSDEDYEKASDEEKLRHDANPYNHVQAPLAMQTAQGQAQQALQPPPEPEDPYGQWNGGQPPDGVPGGDPGGAGEGSGPESEQEAPRPPGQGNPFQKSVRVYVRDL